MESRNLQNLPSPTDYRAGDGASISHISIKTNKKEYYCGEFDSYTPNEKLDKHIKTLKEIRASQQ